MKKLRFLKLPDLTNKEVEYRDAQRAATMAAQKAVWAAQQGHATATTWVPTVGTGTTYDYTAVSPYFTTNIGTTAMPNYTIAGTGSVPMIEEQNPMELEPYETSEVARYLPEEILTFIPTKASGITSHLHRPSLENLTDDVVPAVYTCNQIDKTCFLTKDVLFWEVQPVKLPTWMAHYTCVRPAPPKNLKAILWGD